LASGGSSGRAFSASFVKKMWRIIVLLKTLPVFLNARCRKSFTWSDVFSGTPPFVCRNRYCLFGEIANHASTSPTVLSLNGRCSV
jgi:hypothetical protein